MGEQPTQSQVEVNAGDPKSVPGDKVMAVCLEAARHILSELGNHSRSEFFLTR